MFSGRKKYHCEKLSNSQICVNLILNTVYKMYMNIFASCHFNFASFSHIVNRQNSAHLNWKVIDISSIKTILQDIAVGQK